MIVFLFPLGEFGGAEMSCHDEVVVFVGLKLLLEAMDDSEDCFALVGEMGGEGFGVAAGDQGGGGVGLDAGGEAEDVGGEGDLQGAEVIG